MNTFKRNCCHFGILSLTSLILLLVTASHAWAYSINGDYSSTSNANGVWTYGWMSSLGGSLNVYTQNVAITGNISGNDTLWLDPNDDLFGSRVPAVGSNAGVTSFVDGSFTLPVGWAYFAPGLQGEFSVIRFTAPATGSYAINLAFEGGQSAPTDTEVYLYLPGSTLYSANVDGFGAPSLKSYNGLAALTAGQTLDIAVADAGNHGSSDNTNVQGTIAQIVPDACSTMALLAASLAPLLPLVRRRWRS